MSRQRALTSERGARSKMRDGLRVYTDRRGERKWGWQVEIDGRKVSGTCDSEREAKEARDNARAGRYKSRPSRTDLTVAQAVEAYLAAKAADWRENSRDARRAQANTIVREFGPKLLADLTPRDVELWLQKLAHLNARTRANMFGLLRTIVRKCVVRGELELDPTRGIDRPHIRHAAHASKAVRQEETLDAEGMARLVKLTASDPIIGALVHLICATGCRRGEALALRWSRIDFANARVTFAQSASRYGLGPTKTGHVRTIRVDPALMAALGAHKDRQQVEAQLRGREWTDDWLVFPTDTYRWPDQPLHPDRAMAIVRRYDASLSGFHVLRHSHGSVLHNMGIPLAVIAERLGDALATIVQTYTHADQSKAVEAGEVFGKLLR